MAHEERRRNPRATVESVQGRLVLASHVAIQNLSLGGVALTVDRRLDIGRDYVVRFQGRTGTIEVKGTVAWSELTALRRRGGETVPEYSVGLRFTSFVSGVLEDLMGFIDAHKVSMEKRVTGRFRIDPSGEVDLEGGPSYRVKIISRSGMLIETPEPLERDGVYDMELTVAPGQVIQITGRVAYCSPPATDTEWPHEVGIEFLRMSNEDQGRLEALLGSLAAA
jgi:hypothetical protein